MADRRERNFNLMAIDRIGRAELQQLQIEFLQVVRWIQNYQTQVESDHSLVWHRIVLTIINPQTYLGLEAIVVDLQTKVIEFAVVNLNQIVRFLLILADLVV